MYILINGSEEHYDASVESFKTQNGNTGIRIIGDVPETDQGFKVFDDNDALIGDFSAFTYLYASNEYTVSEERHQESECGIYVEPQPVSEYQMLSSQINDLNTKIVEITPYTESKTAYIDDTYVIFDMPKEGNVSIYMTDGDGQNVPCTFERINGKIKVSFDKRESLATVNISIQ